MYKMCEIKILTQKWLYIDYASELFIIALLRNLNVTAGIGSEILKPQDTIQGNI